MLFVLIKLISHKVSVNSVLLASLFSACVCVENGMMILYFHLIIGSICVFTVSLLVKWSLNFGYIH